jgi:hypothetical protein
MGYMLTKEALDATKEKIEKINRRAQRRGLSGLLTVESEQTTVKRTVAGIEIEEVRYETSITGEAPKHNGWVFLATLEFLETGVIVRAVPGAPLCDRDQLVPNKCDHCNTYRRRNETYVVRNEETGIQMQVGSTCLKDFLGWSGTVAFLTEEDCEREISGFLNYGTPDFTTESILAVAWACVTEFGYVRSGDEGATRSTVWEVMCAKETKHNRALKDRISVRAAEAIPMAQKLRAFILSDEFNGESDYVINLKTYCAAELNASRSFGFLASVPQAYAKHLERTLIRERQNADRVNEFIGEIKKRQTFKVKIRAIKYVPDYYSGGSKPLYTLITDTGHTLKWFASSDALLGDDVTPEDEDFFSLTGTVVKHEEYNGYKSTCVNRCKLG